MEFNKFVFPIPNSSYTPEDHKGELIWIPRKDDLSYRDRLKYTNYKSFLSSNDSCRQSSKRSYCSINQIPTISFSIENKFIKKTEKSDEYIPCLYLRSKETKSDRILIYFHANYEDIGNSYQVASIIQKSLKINILCIEYPGYGIYTQANCNSDEIIKDSEIIYKFLINIMSIPENKIIILGRCIGSGPALHLASKFKPHSLILISPFMSIKHAVNSIFERYNMGWLFQNLVKERFNNIEIISKVKCPILIIHGKSDEIIPWEHSLKLVNNCTSAAKLITPEKMEHNIFEIFEDIIIHIKNFLIVFNEVTDFNSEADFNEYDDEISEEIYFPLFMFSNPRD